MSCQSSISVLFPIAWRNLWRHKTRTLLTILYVTLGVTLIASVGIGSKSVAYSVEQSMLGALKHSDIQLKVNETYDWFEFNDIVKAHLNNTPGVEIYVTRQGD
ncbi:MAG: hypothetical protein RBG13Loki_3673 [Promethearchaeota archaeon CR_4]|nr:MAG: hypothetical protein RBG13Loki_3673 [Candidatus Lokiarchaeota archaeon CR_4]